MRIAAALALVISVASGFSRTPIVASGFSRTSDTAADVTQRLIGNWKLVKYETFDQNGAVRPGRYDVGRVAYEASGEMTAHLMRSGGSKDAPTTDAAQAAAYQSYIGYFGPFTVDALKGTVTHHVIGSSFPHWVGTEQVRSYGFSDDGNQLTLSVKAGERLTATLTWVRVK
jgi:hypothetical protein